MSSGPAAAFPAAWFAAAACSNSCWSAAAEKRIVAAFRASPAEGGAAGTSAGGVHTGKPSSDPAFGASAGVTAGVVGAGPAGAPPSVGGAGGAGGTGAAGTEGSAACCDDVSADPPDAFCVYQAGAA
ncbi:hypothetical protein E4K10_31230 [Streptomyces sp. T1317-0309]|nr:hypothetical protein E4K10_31230 [Streptomyces sp. T1317-0309]